MPNLTTQTAKINAVISLKDKSYNSIKSAIMVDLKEWCDVNCKMYAFIMHDSDILETGEHKTNHIHLVALLNSNRCRLSTTLNNLSAATGVDTLAISIDKCQDFNGSIQYLIHKNNDDKYQYDVNDIVTNLTDSELNIYLSAEGDSISLESLIAVIKRYRSMIDIIRAVGLGVYRVYRNVIWDIYSEVYLQ